MKTNAAVSSSSWLLPTGLGVLGALCIAASLVLLPLFVQRMAADQPRPPCPVCPACPTCPVCPAVPDVPAPIDTATDTGTANDETETEAAAPSATSDGPWAIPVGIKSLAIEGDGDAAVAEIARALQVNGKARAKVLGLVGVGGPAKQAKSGARVVRDAIVAAGVESRRMWTDTGEEAAVKGLLVRVEIVGGR